MADLRPPEEMVRYREAISRPIPDRFAAGVWHHRKKDGTIIEVDVHVHRVLLEGHEAWLATARDVTKQRELEQQLLQSQKMEAIGQLAGGVAHDFNNLLTVIGGNTELALLDLSADHPASQTLDEVRHAVRRATALVNQLLTFGRRKAVEARLLPLDQLVRGMESMLRRLLRSDLRLETRLGAESLVKADAGQLEQVVVNLLVNARDAVPEAGRITLETRDVVVEEPPACGPRPPQPGRWVLLAVSDTGAGIPPDVQHRIFDPFFTTKGPQHGTGLGLATVYGIVEQAGGGICVRPVPEGGTRFEIYLPAHPAKDDAASSSPAARGQEPTERHPD